MDSKKFAWERLPYDEEVVPGAAAYLIDAADGVHRGSGSGAQTVIHLSNDVDPCEYIELESRAHVDELITRLQIARDDVFPAPEGRITDVDRFYGDPVERFRAMATATVPASTIDGAHFRMWCKIAADEIEDLRKQLATEKGKRNAGS
jgi:hypothetical protein